MVTVLRRARKDEAQHARYHAGRPPEATPPQGDKPGAPGFPRSMYGMWMRFSRHDIASFTCPNCGKMNSTNDRTVDRSGKVSGGSFACGHACGFSDTLVLKGWDGRRPTG